MKKGIFHAAVLVVLLTTRVSPGFSQTSSELKSFLSQRIGLSQDQIAAIQNGQPVAKNMDSRSPAEIFVFGVVYINATPGSYVKFASDFNRLSQVPGFLHIVFDPTSFTIQKKVLATTSEILAHIICRLR
jgi:hypothetical protein